MAAEFRVLGPLQVVAADGRDLTLAGPQQRTVLATLVLRANSVVPTGSIVQAIWGEPAPPSARAVIRTYASRLRKVLGAVGDVRLEGKPPGYVLEVDPRRVDAHRFAELVEQGRAAAGAGRPEVGLAAFEVALGLWRGDILADLGRVEALRPEVTRLEEMRLAAVESRIDLQLAAGHHGEVAVELESLTAAHPFRERLWCQLIVALYRCGRQADALAAYQSVRSILVDQLGVEPGPELQALEHNVLAQSPALLWGATGGRLGPVALPAVATPILASPKGNSLEELPQSEVQIPLPPGLAQPVHGHPFVGRGQEQARLAGYLDQARAGRFVAAFVAGSPGIGKTALAARFSCRAHAEGATVVLGRADEGAGIPFLPLGEAIRHWVAHVPAARLSLLGQPDAAHLARLVPELVEGSVEPHPAPVPDPVSPADRQHLFRAIRRWVEALADASPAVVVLEDLHWADPATLLAVRYLLRHPPDAGALLVGTYRTSETGNPSELADLLACVGGEGRGLRVDLHGLLDTDVADLLSAQAAGQLDPGGRTFATRLNQAVGGNPLFVHEMIQHLTERGLLQPAAQRWPDQPSTSFGVPPAVVDVIGQRLQRLPRPTTVLLRQAAVLGDQFDLTVLSRVAGVTEISVVESMGPAVSAGFVAHQDQRPDRLVFTHSLVREAILERVPLSQRARTHWKAGQTVASLSAAWPEPPLGEIARHLAAGVRAGDPQAAVVANVRAGWQALTGSGIRRPSHSVPHGR